MKTLSKGDTETLSLSSCLSECEILFSLYKFTDGAEIKTKDSFPNCINNFMQVTAEGRLRWTFSFSSNRLEICSFYLLSYFVLPKNISSFNSFTNTPDGLCHSLSLCYDHIDNNLWTAVIVAVGIFQHLKVIQEIKEISLEKFSGSCPTNTPALRQGQEQLCLLNMSK